MNCADIDIITASFAPEGGEGKCGVFITAAAVTVCVHDLVKMFSLYVKGV